MSKATEQNGKLKRAIVISAVLYVISFATLVWSSFGENTEASAEGGDGSSIDAVMVDSGAIAEQYKRIQSQGSSAERSDEQRKMKEQQAVEELCGKQVAKQERLKRFEKEWLAAQEQKKWTEEVAKQAELKQKQTEEAAAKVAADARVKVEADAKTMEEAARKMAADTKKKVEAEAARAAAEVQKETEVIIAAPKRKAEMAEATAAEARKEAVTEAAEKAKAEAEKKAVTKTAEKAKAEAEKKAIAKKAVADKKTAAGKTVADKEVAERAAVEEAVVDRKAVTEKAAADKKAVAAKAVAGKVAAAKAAAEVDDIFGELSSSKNVPKMGGGAKGSNVSPAGSGNTKNNGILGAGINNYVGQIKSVIENKFYDASSHAGKTCMLRIKLTPDGMLLDIKPEGGDPALCQAALVAAKSAKIPKLPSQAAYEVFKDAPLDFEP